jgi:hypothetical protein
MSGKIYSTTVKFETEFDDVTMKDGKFISEFDLIIEGKLTTNKKSPDEYDDYIFEVITAKGWDGELQEDIADVYVQEIIKREEEIIHDEAIDKAPDRYTWEVINA